MFSIPDIMATAQETTNGTSSTAVTSNDSALAFVAKFGKHHQRCVALAKRFSDEDPDFKNSAAIAQLCRATQEMLEQAKEARTLTEIYLALDEQHRDSVRPIITERFKDIAKLARASWQRFSDSMELARNTRPEIAIAQREFQPHAEQFQRALREFITMSAGAG